MKKPFAKRSLGQNFLVDQSAISRIVASIEPKPSDTIIEIGPGRGALTEKLVASEAKIVAIEIDRDLVTELRIRFSEKPNFTVVENDILDLDLSSFGGDKPGSLKLIANLPYYISTAVLQSLARQRKNFSSLVLMFQREVVERITAPPGSSDRGFLTVICESAFSTERLFDLSPAAFRPSPKVWSSVVKLTPKRRSEADETGFHALVSAGFAQKRKTILNNLKALNTNASEILSRSAIDPQRRAETLHLDEWRTLYRATLAASEAK